jgi:hypothetical protein
MHDQDIVSHWPVPALDVAKSDIVVRAPARHIGCWAGAPSAVVVDDTYWLAYRLREPEGRGRGFRNVIARSSDGVRFDTVAELDRDLFGGESLERPALVALPGGGWRVYVSVALPGSKAWRIDVLEAPTAEALPGARPRTVLTPTTTHAPKDPVIRRGRDGAWHLWASVHLIEDPDEADRMETHYATSDDGVHWRWRGIALSPRTGTWNARGARLSTVLLGGSRPLAYFDGRASAAENWEERTGVAIGTGNARFWALGAKPAYQSPHAGGALRYVDVVGVPERRGAWRAYFEAAADDGAHDLHTQLLVTSARTGMLHDVG